MNDEEEEEEEEEDENVGEDESEVRVGKGIYATGTSEEGEERKLADGGLCDSAKIRPFEGSEGEQREESDIHIGSQETAR